MRKSILGACGTVAVLALLFYEKNYMTETADENIYKALAVGEIICTEEYTAMSETEHEMVKAAEFPQEGGVITIEDEAVPLAAMPVTAKEEAVSKKVNKQEEKAVAEKVTSKKENIILQKEEPKAETPAKNSNLEDLGGGVCGYYDEEASASLLAQINVMRGDIGALSAELNDIARRRALSCVKSFSHDGMETAGECMAIGQADAVGVITSWYASDEHRTYVSDPAYTQAGAACIRYDKGNGEIQTIWVLVLN